MTIKRITASEANLVINLFDQYRVFYQKPSDIALATAFINDRLANNESVIFVALVNNNGTETPAGFTQLYPIYSSVRAVKNWLLNDLYVGSSHRKQGIGEALIRTAMTFALEGKSKYVELSTAVTNTTAQRLYESIGFERQPPETDFYTYRITL